jgi:hypothetical protein
VEHRKNTPYEVGLGWTVQLDRGPFVGRDALRREKEAGSKRTFVGLDISWSGVEKIFAGYGLPPELPVHAWRDGRQVQTPFDLEATYGATGGHLYHGEHAIDQLAVRPIPECTGYRTPFDGLYLCGSGSHPGGDITCAPGALAAGVILGG